MRKLLFTILPIIYALDAVATNGCVLGKSEELCNPGFSYKVCEINGQTKECTGDMLPSNATEAACTSSGRQGYKICTAVTCNDGYTPKGGRCVKNSAASASTQQVASPQVQATDIHICGMTVYQGTNENDTQVDYIISDVTISGANLNCTSNSRAEFDCSTTNATSAQITFEKPGFQKKTVDVSNFQKYNCPRVVLIKDSNDAPTPNASGNNSGGDARTTMCKNSGGSNLDNNSKCICDPESFLETTTVGDISICQCMKGYKRKSGNYTDACIPAGDVTEEEILDAEATQTAQALHDYESARNNEQSWANKGLTAATTLATGEGAMAATQAYFEQRADADAERDMAAYLATFKCEYGGGKTFNAGNEELFLPGGNELLNYYSEYKTLADSVKQTKTALGLRSGIESEVLYDRAQSGLYQYAKAEQTSGGEISLSRALQNPEGIDAEKWNAQKAQTAQNLQTGLYTMGGGIVAGILGNYLINANREREEVAQIFKPVRNGEDQYHEQEFEEIIAQQTPDDAPTATPQTAPQSEIFNKPYPSDKWFKSGSFDITSDGESELDDQVVGNIKTALQTSPQTQFYITVVGHTDGVPVKKNSSRQFQNNKELSKLRAQSVVNYLQSKLSEYNNNSINYKSSGEGEQYCKSKDKKINDSSCRKVVITIEDKTPYRDYIK